jgi:hypothetical protein
MKKLYYKNLKGQFCSKAEWFGIYQGTKSFPNANSDFAWCQYVYAKMLKEKDLFLYFAEYAISGAILFKDAYFCNSAAFTINPSGIVEVNIFYRDEPKERIFNRIFNIVNNGIKNQEQYVKDAKANWTPSLLT